MDNIQIEETLEPWQEEYEKAFSWALDQIFNPSTKEEEDDSQRN